MLNVENREVTVKSVQIKQTVKAESGDGALIRVAMEAAQLTSEEMAALPCGGAAEAAVEDGKTVDEEGPNSVTLTVRRLFPIQNYRIARAGETEVIFDASVVNRPAVKIVEGVAALHWNIEATVSAEDVASLATKVRSDFTTMTTKTLQSEMDFEKAAA